MNVIKKTFVTIIEQKRGCLVCVLVLQSVIGVYQEELGYKYCVGKIKDKDGDCMKFGYGKSNRGTIGGEQGKGGRPWIIVYGTFLAAIKG